MPRIFPTGVTTYDPAHAYNSYVIFGSPDGKTHLIDMNGNEVHEWRHSGFPSEMLDPKVTDGKLGHVLVQLKGQGFNNKTIAELDWDGNVVWQWGEKAPGGAANLALRY